MTASFLGHGAAAKPSQLISQWHRLGKAMIILLQVLIH